MLKRLVSLVMAVSIVLSFVPSTVFATEGENTTILPTTQTVATEPNGGSAATEPVGATAEPISGEEGGWNWSLNGTVLTISGEGAMNDYSLQDVVPWDPSITKVVITSGITTIGAYAFYGCSNLTEIVIPDTVQSIGEYAFYNCAALTEVHIPEGVKEIAANTFFGCASLQEMIVPDSVQTISAGAFAGCSGLYAVTIPASMTKVGEEAFSGCKKLQTIEFQGTQAQWDKITKGTNWDYMISNYTINAKG